MACKRLSMLGGRTAIVPMAALLNHPQLGGYARFGMEPIRTRWWTSSSVWHWAG